MEMGDGDGDAVEVRRTRWDGIGLDSGGNMHGARGWLDQTRTQAIGDAGTQERGNTDAG